MKDKIAPVNKAVYGSIGAFVAMMIVQLLIGWLNSNNVDVTPDQQAQLTSLFNNLIVSALSAVGTYAAIYQAPANKVTKEEEE